MILITGLTCAAEEQEAQVWVPNADTVEEPVQVISCNVIKNLTTKKKGLLSGWGRQGENPPTV